MRWLKISPIKIGLSKNVYLRQVHKHFLGLFQPPAQTRFDWLGQNHHQKDWGALKHCKFGPINLALWDRSTNSLLRIARRIPIEEGLFL